METNQPIGNNNHLKTKKKKSLKRSDVQALSDRYIGFAETSQTKDRTVRRISLPIGDLILLLEAWKTKLHKTVTIAAGRTDQDLGIIMLGAGNDSSPKVWVDCYDVFSAADIGSIGDDSGKLFCPPPAVCKL